MNEEEIDRLIAAGDVKMDALQRERYLYLPSRLDNLERVFDLNQRTVTKILDTQDELQKHDDRLLDVTMKLIEEIEFLKMRFKFQQRFNVVYNSVAAASFTGWILHLFFGS